MKLENITLNWIMERVTVQPGALDTPCWLWNGSLHPWGYGQLRCGPGKTTAHCNVYEALVGPIPEGMQLDHLCNPKTGDRTNRRCINPSHLEIVTPKQNTTRGTRYQSLKTHCPKGHEYTESNIYWNPVAKFRPCRTCRICRKMEPARLPNPRPDFIGPLYTQLNQHIR